MGIQARRIVRDARKMGTTISPRSYRTCAIGIMAAAKGIDDVWSMGPGRQAVADAYGLTLNQLNSVEVGFEGPHRGWLTPTPHKTYLKVGQNLAKMVGHTPF